MMRPMKLAGSQLMFGEGSLEFLKTINTKKVAIVTCGKIMEENGILPKVREYLESNKAEIYTFDEAEFEPSIELVLRGAKELLRFEPDLILAVGGGSVMDAAKAMWIFYEHPDLKTLSDILPPNKIPKLREKAIFCCIPSTSGTGSEVSRSIVITDDKTGIKYGIGDMEMMPDIAICDPIVTVSMPPKITAETGMDALTHAIEALTSNRSNYISDILAKQAAKDIIETLPKVYKDGKNIKLREIMLNASLSAGMSFTNVSLGIVHSMAHTLGSFFHVPHGLANAILLPYIIKFNKSDEKAKKVYHEIKGDRGVPLYKIIEELNEKLNIPRSFKEIINDENKYMSMLDTLASTALNDGCTKTNPIIPSIHELKELFILAYEGETLWI